MYVCARTHLVNIDGIISDGVRAKRLTPTTHWHSDMAIEEVEAQWCDPLPGHRDYLKTLRENQWCDFNTPYPSLPKSTSKPDPKDPTYQMLRILLGQSEFGK